MRISKLFIIIAFVCCGLSIISGCKEDESQIEFPSEGFYGLNVLGNNNFTIQPDSAYSFMADIPDGKKLTVIMTNTSDSLRENSFDEGSFWYIPSSNWLANGYDYVEQKGRFVAYGPMVAILKIEFELVGEKGGAYIEFFENEETEHFRTKSIIWE